MRNIVVLVFLIGITFSISRCNSGDRGEIVVKCDYRGENCNWRGVNFGTKGRY